MRVPRSATNALAAAILVTMIGPTPAASRSFEGVKRDLKKIEDQLRAGEWQFAKVACDRALNDLIEDDARGKGTRPVFGLVLAFRAVAEAGLGETRSATWDWTAATQFSSAATGFDLARFQVAGQALKEALAREAEAIEVPGPVKPRGKLANPEIPTTVSYRNEAFKCSVKATLIIDSDGRPVRVRRLDGGCTEAHTALAALALETQRDWRFEPVMRDGRSVPIQYEFTTVFERRFGWMP